MNNKDEVQTIEHDKSQLEEIVIEAENNAIKKLINKEIEIIDEYKHTEEYFNNKVKYYNKEFSKLIKSALKYYKNPYELVKKIEFLWAEMVLVRVVSQDWVNEQRLKLYNELMKPEEFKAVVGDTYNNIKKKGLKLKNKFTKSQK